MQQVFLPLSEPECVLMRHFSEQEQTHSDFPILAWIKEKKDQGYKIWWQVREMPHLGANGIVFRPSGIGFNFEDDGIAALFKLTWG